MRIISNKQHKQFEINKKIHIKNTKINLKSFTFSHSCQCYHRSKYIGHQHRALVKSLRARTLINICNDTGVSDGS